MRFLQNMLDWWAVSAMVECMACRCILLWCMALLALSCQQVVPEQALTVESSALVRKSLAETSSIFLSKPILYYSRASVLTASCNAPNKMYGKEAQEIVEILSRGSAPSFFPRNAKSTDKSERFALEFSDSSGNRLAELPLDQIWSRSQEMEAQSKGQRAAGKLPPPLLVLDDADYDLLDKKLHLKELYREYERMTCAQRYMSVLNSGTDERRAQIQKQYGDKPVVILEKLPEGLGATRQERMQAFLHLYELGMDINTSDEYGYTGLGYACALGDMALVRELCEKYKPNLKHGMPVHHSDEEDCHCCDGMFNTMPGYVEVALRNGHKDIARYLLSLKAAPLGVQCCIEQDDLPMLRELLAAGASVHEGEEERPNTLLAPSVEMLRFLLSKGCPALMPQEYLWWIPRDKPEKRALLLQAGVVSQQDIDDFDHGGLSKLDSVDKLPLPPRKGKEVLLWSWMPASEARKAFCSLVGTDTAAQDAAVLRMLRQPISARELKSMRTYGWWQKRQLLYVAMLIVGDERFAALLEKVNDVQREVVAIVLTSELRSDAAQIRNAYPRTLSLLHL